MYQGGRQTLHPTPAQALLRDRDAEGGAKLEVVGRILGHSSIGITADIYRFVETGEMHEAVERFGPQNGSVRRNG